MFTFALRQMGISCVPCAVAWCRGRVGRGERRVAGRGAACPPHYLVEEAIDPIEATRDGRAGTGSDGHSTMPLEQPGASGSRNGTPRDTQELAGKPSSPTRLGSSMDSPSERVTAWASWWVAPRSGQMGKPCGSTHPARRWTPESSDVAVPVPVPASPLFLSSAL